MAYGISCAGCGGGCGMSGYGSAAQGSVAQLYQVGRLGALARRARRGLGSITPPGESQIVVDDQGFPIDDGVAFENNEDPQLYQPYTEMDGAFVPSMNTVQTLGPAYDVEESSVGVSGFSTLSVLALVALGYYCFIR